MPIGKDSARFDIILSKAEKSAAIAAAEEDGIALAAWVRQAIREKLRARGVTIAPRKLARSRPRRG